MNLFQPDTKPPCGVISTKCEGRETPDKGRGVFAIAPIAKGEHLATWGGRIVPYDELLALEPEVRRLTLQIDEGLFLLTQVEGPADWFNHSCEPNAGLVGQIGLYAMRDIKEGEEITFDYAMSDGCDYDEFPCLCGSRLCRGKISGDDWKRSELWARYGKHFSPYLQRRIETYKNEMLARNKANSKHHPPHVSTQSKTASVSS